MSSQPLVPAHRAHPLRTSLRTISALVLREMASRYGRSPGGYMWAVLEPIGVIAILSLGFSLLMRSPPLGSSFVMFYATGFLNFNFSASMSTTRARSLRFSRSLLAYPIVSWMDAILARIILNGLTSLLVAYIVLTGVVMVTGEVVELKMGAILLSFVMAASFGVGVGLVNCVLIGFFPVWGTVWSVVTRPLFLISGVIFIYDDFPPNIQAILWWNPLIHASGEMRYGFYPMYEASYASPLYVFSVALSLIALGLVLVRRYNKDILQR